MSPNLKSVPEQWHIRTLTYRLADALVIIAGWLLATSRLGPDTDHSHALAMTLTIVVFHFVGEITGMYRNWRGVSVDKEVVCAMLTWLITLPILVTVVALVGLGSIELPFLTRWLSLALVCMAITRIALRSFQKFLTTRGYNTRGFAVIGVNSLAFRVAENIENTPEMGLKLVGFYDDRKAERTPDIDPRIGEKIGDMDELLTHAQNGDVTMIYITFPMRAEDRIRGILDRLADTTAASLCLALGTTTHCWTRTSS